MTETANKTSGLDALYARMSPKELRVQIRNDNAIARAGSLQKAYGTNRSREVPGRGEWAGTFWCLKGDIADGPFDCLIDAVNHGRELDGLPPLSGFPRNAPLTHAAITKESTP